MGSPSNLKQKLLEALQASVVPGKPVDLPPMMATQQQSTSHMATPPRKPTISVEPVSFHVETSDSLLDNGRSVYSILTEETEDEAVVASEFGQHEFLSRDTSERKIEIKEEGLAHSLPEELQQSSVYLNQLLRDTQEQTEAVPLKGNQKPDFDGTLSMRGVVPDVQTETTHPAGAPSSFLFRKRHVQSESVISGGSMADLSGYKDLSKAPMSFGDDDMPMSSLSPDTGFDRGVHMPPVQHFSTPTQHFVQEVSAQEVDTEFSGNVKTLIRLVNELPEGVTKQTGAQIIRLTMEAMGISMEDVLSEAQSAQSEMLDAVRANIKKIEEYKTVIRKLETDIKYYQGKANELSEIIDLFILSNTSSQKMPMPDDMNH